MKIILILTLVTHFAWSQDFDADSARYTPISKPTAQRKPYLFKRDTIHEKQLIRYYFNFQSGALLGCTSCTAWEEVTLSASTLHGISIGKKLRAGAGIGLDTYDQWKTMPLFGSASWDLAGSRNGSAVFFQVNYGWAHSWRKRSVTDFNLKDIDGGRMISAQAGYRIKYHDLNIWISVGPKTQRVYTYLETPTFYINEDGIMVQGTPNKTTIKQNLNRFMISFALGWK